MINFKGLYVLIDTSWYYNDSPINEFPENATGFVYKITNLKNQKIYIGKKTLTFCRTKSVKGVKKKVKLASDWEKYYGSSKWLLEDIKILGKENFKREILRICFSKSEANYFEAFHQFQYGVLLTDSYNGHIFCRIHRNSTLNGPQK